VFVLVVVALLVVAVVLMGRAQGWFEAEYTLRVKFPPEGSYGIKKGATVSILETPVGMVEEVLVNDDGSMEGVLQIRGRFIRFVRSDSTAILKKQFGVAGDTFIEITRGSGAPLADGSALPLPAVKDTELVEMLQGLVKQVQDAVMPVLEQVRRLAEEYTGLAADLRDPEGHLQQLLARLDQLATGLQEGEGTAGKLLKDPSTVEAANAAIVSLKGSLAELERIMTDVRQATAELPETVFQTREALRDTERLLEGLQKHWLLRKYVDQPVSSNRIEPGDVGLPGGTKPWTEAPDSQQP
jgi:phospholipid/cholesterol/gamma-HCH transport system substrate-binding protein